MNAGLIEIVGLFLVVIGCGAIVAAASMVAPALAVLAAGLFAALFGVIAIYLANAADAKRRAREQMPS